jgi:hypothetical protein
LGVWLSSRAVATNNAAAGVDLIIAKLSPF